MENKNIIECTYGHHETCETNFSKSGLNNKYYTICKDCSRKKLNDYRKRNKEKVNEKAKDYQREYMKKWRQQKKILEK